MWLFLLAALHRMQALSALACSVGCGFVAFASLKIALFIQPLKKGTTHFYFWVVPFIGGEIQFTAEFADIQCARLLCCETTFRTKTI